MAFRFQAVGGTENSHFVGRSLIAFFFFLLCRQWNRYDRSLQPALTVSVMNTLTFFSPRCLKVNKNPNWQFSLSRNARIDSPTLTCEENGKLERFQSSLGAWWNEGERELTFLLAPKRYRHLNRCDFTLDWSRPSTSLGRQQKQLTFAVKKCNFLSIQLWTRRALRCAWLWHCLAAANAGTTRQLPHSRIGIMIVGERYRMMEYP